MPRWLAPTTSRVGPVPLFSCPGCVAGPVVLARICVRVALETSPMSPIKRVTTPTEPGGTTTADACVTSYRYGLILYVPGVSTSFCTPFSPGLTTSDPACGALPCLAEL